MLQRAYVDLGEPSDMDPFTYTLGVPDGLSTIGATMLGVLNEGQVALATWKFPDGQRLRFPGLRDWFFIQATLSTGTLAAGQASPYSTLAGDFTGMAGRVIVVAGEAHLILTASGTEAALEAGFASDPSELDYTIYKKVFGVSDALTTPVGDVLSVYGVYDFASRRRLPTFESSAEDFASIGYGNHGKVRIRGKTLTFDSAPSEGRFGVEVYRAPVALVALASESELPPQYHEGLVYFLEHWGFVYMNETEAAYGMKRDLNDFLRLRRSEDDLADDHRDIHLVPRVG
jgi:hypothetical protein